MTKQELLKNAKPILLNTAMVRKILDNVAKNSVDLECIKGRCRYKVGDVLWVRETWTIGKISKIKSIFNGNEKIIADDFIGKGDARVEVCGNGNDYLYKEDCLHKNIAIGYANWHPSVHMPKDATRIFLKVTGVSVRAIEFERVTVDE